jgi:hypothetical protein
LGYDVFWSCEIQPTFRGNIASVFRVEEYAKQETGVKKGANREILVVSFLAHFSTLKMEAIYYPLTLCPLGKRSLYPLDMYWVVFRAGLDDVEKFLALAANRTPTVQPVARHYTDCLFSSPLSRMPTWVF